MLTMLARPPPTFVVHRLAHLLADARLRENGVLHFFKFLKFQVAVAVLVEKAKGNLKVPPRDCKQKMRQLN